MTSKNASAKPVPAIFRTLASQELYVDLLHALEPLGAFEVENKKTCVHLVRKSAFMGVHPRKDGLMVTIKSPAEIKNKRVAKAEQVSKSRWHIDVKLSGSGDIDASLLKWAKGAYEMSS